MSNYLEFQGKEEFERHVCHGKREGDWLIFSCPHCSYERRFNRATGEMKVRHGLPTALHSGQHLPVGIDFNTLNAN